MTLSLSRSPNNSYRGMVILGIIFKILKKLKINVGESLLKGIS